MASQQNISERLITIAVEKQVHEALGNMLKGFSDMTKVMTAEDAHDAKILVLEAVRTACGTFYMKMKDRIDRNEADNIDNGRRVSR